MTLLGAGRPLVQRDLEERAAAAEQRYRYHRERFSDALGALRRLGAECPGVSCPEVRDAGQALALCELCEIEAAVRGFSLAILESARRCPTAGEGAPLVRLSDQAAATLRDLAHHVGRQMEASRRARELIELRRLAESLAEAAGEERTTSQ